MVWPMEGCYMGPPKPIIKGTGIRRPHFHSPSNILFWGNTLTLQFVLKCLFVFPGEPEPDPVNHAYLTRFKNWGYWPYDYPCAGKRVRWICIFSTGDLPLLASRYELFANKFHMDYEPLTYDCMEELLFTKTREEYSNKRTFNTTFYFELPFVLNSYQVPDNYSASALS
jgi:hypothetical protein